MTPLRVGIVGLSGIAARRPETTLFGRVCTSHATAYATSGACEVVGVCDLRPDLVHSFRHVWADTWSAIAGYEDHEEMLREAGLDILSVATPDDRHAEVVVAAAEAGVRGILCEKPIATSLADADAMVAAVRASGSHMVVDHTRRYLPLFHLARDLLRRGELGDVRALRCLHTGPRPMLFRNGCHAVDALCFLAGSRAVEVSGRLEAGYDHWDRYRGDGGHDSAGEPAATAQWVFENGIEAAYDGIRTADALLRCEIVGSKADARVHPRHLELSRGGATQVLVPDGYDTTGIAAAVNELVSLVNYGGETISPPEEARHTLEILLAILASHQRGGAPVALPLEEPA